jgi:hypothetical protein
MVEKLVWLPTWHQACLLRERMSFGREGPEGSPRLVTVANPTDALLAVYELIMDALGRRQG